MSEMEILLEKIRQDALRYGPGWLEQQVQGFQPPVGPEEESGAGLRRSGRQRQPANRGVKDTPGVQKRPRSPSRDPRASPSQQRRHRAAGRSGRNPARRPGLAAGGARAPSGGERLEVVCTAPPADDRVRGRAQRRGNGSGGDTLPAAAGSRSSAAKAGGPSSRGAAARRPEVEPRGPSCVRQRREEVRESSRGGTSGRGPEPEGRPSSEAALMLEDNVELLPAGGSNDDFYDEVGEETEEEQQVIVPPARGVNIGRRSVQRAGPRASEEPELSGYGVEVAPALPSVTGSSGAIDFTAAGVLARGRPGESTTTNVSDNCDMGMGTGPMGWFLQGLQELFMRGVQAGGGSPANVWGVQGAGVAGGVVPRLIGASVGVLGTGGLGGAEPVVANAVAAGSTAVGVTGAGGVEPVVVSAVAAGSSAAVVPVVAIGGSGEKGKMVDDTRLGDDALGQIYVCFEGPLGSHLKQEVREKIWKDEFVEIFSLLPLQKFNLDKGKPDESKKEEEERRRYRLIPRTFANWLQAFSILGSVIGQKAPENCSGLFCYQEVIGEAYRVYGGTGWLQYDEEFRQRKAVRPTIRWDHKDISLWVRHMTAPKTAGHPFSGAAGGSRTAAGRSAGGGKGCCWQYNEGHCKYGSECRFKHECSGCGGGSHPYTRCFKRGKGRGGDGDQKRSDAGEAGKDAPVAKGVPR